VLRGAADETWGYRTLGGPRNPHKSRYLNPVFTSIQPTHPTPTPAHNRQSVNCAGFKPLPGMVIQAKQKWAINLSASLLIGDGERDRQLGARCGIPFALVRDGRPRKLNIDQAQVAAQ